MTLDESRLPSYALLSPENLRLYEAATERGLFNVQPGEEFWRDRYHSLYARGYQLRPRYSPDWKPSWIGTRADPIFCEDSIASVVGFTDFSALALSLQVHLSSAVSTMTLWMLPGKKMEKLCLSKRFVTTIANSTSHNLSLLQISSITQ